MELMCWEKLGALFCLLDDKSDIHIPKSQLWCLGGSVDGFGFKLSYEQVSHNGADGGSHGCPINLFIILTL